MPVRPAPPVVPTIRPAGRRTTGAFANRAAGPRRLPSRRPELLPAFPRLSRSDYPQTTSAGATRVVEAEAASGIDLIRPRSTRAITWSPLTRSGGTPRGAGRSHAAPRIGQVAPTATTTCARPSLIFGIHTRKHEVGPNRERSRGARRSSPVRVPGAAGGPAEQGLRAEPNGARRCAAAPRQLQRRDPHVDGERRPHVGRGAAAALRLQGGGRRGRSFDRDANGTAAPNGARRSRVRSARSAVGNRLPPRCAAPLPLRGGRRISTSPRRSRP